MNYSPYQNQQDQTQRGSSSEAQGGGKVVSTLLALVITGSLLWGMFRFVPLPHDNTDPSPIPSPNDKVVLADTYIVRMYETESDKMPVWLVKLMDEDAFWNKWIPEQGMSYYTIDPTSNPKDAESFLEAAKKRNISPPCWLHCKKGGVVLSATAFKQTDKPSTLISIIMTGR